MADVRVQSSHFIWLLVFMSLHIFAKVWTSMACQSPQYMQLWTTSTVECQFDLGLFNIYWYILDGNYDRDPIVRYEKEHVPPIFGSGVDEGTYSINTDGSLIISNVTTINQTTYKVVAYDRKDQRYEDLHITVQIIVMSDKYPRINVCGNQRNCLIKSSSLNNLNCSFENARPAVELRWYIQHEGYTETVEGTQSYISDGKFTFTSVLTMQSGYVFKEPLTHLVCEARGLAVGANVVESSVYIDNPSEWNDIVSINKQYQINTEAQLLCVEHGIPYTYIWEKTIADVTELLIFSVDGKQHVNKATPSWRVNDIGDLILSEVDLTSEGTYTCKYFDGMFFGASATIVTVLVAPSPPFLLVDSCAQTTHSCDIVIQPNKVNTTITCEVTGVYPELSLEFINYFPSEIKLWSQTQFTSFRNLRYHVSVSAVVQPLQNFFCSAEKYIVCNAFGPGASSLTNPEKKIQISYEGCKEEVNSATKIDSVIIVVLCIYSIFTVVFVMLIIILCAVCCGYCKSIRRANKTEKNLEISTHLTNMDGSWNIRTPLAPHKEEKSVMKTDYKLKAPKKKTSKQHNCIL
ncbi:uncharacterized protein [Apostichopus japonicus]|uniref:uncharacterized protein isoform X2 n=1 Tax=Stichopus japonicus TaxID=307972 RepID=UPI003AB761B6